MVGKASTKKKLMDLGCPEGWADEWANDRLWYKDIISMNFDDIMNMILYEWKQGPTYLDFFGYSWTDNDAIIRPIYEVVTKMRENELGKRGWVTPTAGQKRVMAEYTTLIENFGRIPAGSPYSYLREDSQNFMNWININPLEVKQ